MDPISHGHELRDGSPINHWPSRVSLTLAAEALGEPDAIVREWAKREEEEIWVWKLRVLGRLWQVAMPALLATAQKAPKPVLSDPPCSGRSSAAQERR